MSNYTKHEKQLIQEHDKLLLARSQDELQRLQRVLKGREQLLPSAVGRNREDVEMDIRIIKEAIAEAKEQIAGYQMVLRSS